MCFCFVVVVAAVFCGCFFFPSEEGESGRSKLALLSHIDIITAQSPNPYQACTFRWKYERVWRNSVVRIKTPYKISVGAGQVPKNSYMPANLTLCNPMDYSSPRSSVIGFSGQEYRSGSPCPPPGGLPNSGIKPVPHVCCTGRWILYH